MPEDRWGPERAQHDFDQRKRSDDRIQSLEDSRDRDRGRDLGRGTGQNGNGIARFLWILVAALVSLAVTGLLGAIVMYRQLGQHETWLEGLQRQVDRHEQREHRGR